MNKMIIRENLKPFAIVAMLALPVMPSCSTTPIGQPAANAPLFLNTIHGWQFYDLQPLKKGEDVQWTPKDLKVLGAAIFAKSPQWCHGEGVEWHTRSNDNAPPGAYRWEGTYDHGKAEGKSTVTYIKTMTCRSITYRQGQIVAQGDPRPLSTSERDELIAKVRGYRDSIFSGLGDDEFDWEAIAADMGLD